MWQSNQSKGVCGTEYKAAHEECLDVKAKDEEPDSMATKDTYNLCWITAVIKRHQCSRAIHFKLDEAKAASTALRVKNDAAKLAAYNLKISIELENKKAERA